LQRRNALQAAPPSDSSVTRPVFGSSRITLPQVPAASGALYRKDGISLHSKGDDALFDDGRGQPRQCTRADLAPPPAATPPAAPGSFVDISGSVSYRARIALPPDAVLVVKVQDSTRADAPALVLAEQRIELHGRGADPFKTGRLRPAAQQARIPSPPASRAAASCCSSATAFTRRSSPASRNPSIWC
jgi:hypothetical protein